MSTTTTDAAATIAWIDTNGCDQFWHAIVRDGDGMLHVAHADYADCEEAECMVPKP